MVEPRRRFRIPRGLVRLWRQPDHYLWMVGYLRSRGLDTWVRLLMASSTVFYGLLPLALLWTPSGPRGPLARGTTIVTATLVLIAAVPSAWRSTSQRFAVANMVLSVSATAVICLSFSNPLVGIVGCATFALIGGRIAFFHSVRLQSFNLVAGLGTISVLAVEAVDGSTEPLVAINFALVVGASLLTTSVLAHVLVHFLGGDLDNSDADPLTGLCNRRAFYRATHRILAGSGRSAARHLSVMMVDLDDFKRLNDSRGHRAGDAALVNVSRVLEELTPDGAVVARVGGEEFLIADVIDAAAAQRCAEHLCVAVAGIDPHVSASIGVATAELATTPSEHDHVLIDRLIDLADTAMYRAKHAGGNRVEPTVIERR